MSRLSTLQTHLLQRRQPHDESAVPTLPSSPLVENRWADELVAWLRKKDGMRQDVYLIGGYGPLRRWIAMKYCSLAGRGVEYVPLTRDTTESDLKQRKEIREGGSVVFTDLPAVKAALSGRVLVLEGLENCERNVLPIINNLLENREMSLEDGRFLMAPQRFDALVADGSHTKQDLEAKGILRVHEDFRVFALGVPCPPYFGQPLDPPLRSRFQSCVVSGVPMREFVAAARSVEAADDQAPYVEKLAAFAAALSELSVRPGAPKLLATKAPPPSYTALLSCLRQLQLFPSLDFWSALWRAYPWTYLIASHDAMTVLLETLSVLGLDKSKRFVIPTQESSHILTAPQATPGVASSVELCTVSKAAGDAPAGSRAYPCHVGKAAGTLAAASTLTPAQQHALAGLAQSHVAGRDACVVGGKGEGKSAVARAFAAAFGYAPADTMSLYADMSARDLLQKRTTGPKGETTWQITPLVSAAETGNLALLDGLHRLSPGTFNALCRLLEDRELALFDGTVYLPAARYDALAKATPAGGLERRKIRRIHPSFRVVALGVPPARGAGGAGWLATEVQHMFDFHHVSPLLVHPADLHSLMPRARFFEPLLKFASATASRASQLTEGGRPSAVQAQIPPLSLRQLLRIARRVCEHDTPRELFECVSSSVLAELLPLDQRTIVFDLMKEAGLPVFEARKDAGKLEVMLDANSVAVGSVRVARKTPARPELVPDIHFVDIQSQLKVMQSMLKDLALGEHLLLIGNQGVGKNKLCDRVLQLLAWEREYIQLHRDSTVSQLTLQPSLKEGVVVWEDSPLVRAMENGRALVIDEMDKAAPEVICVLKGLLEDGEILLADGRRFVTARSHLYAAGGPFRRVHQDFRVIALANRPGYPFLGNDCYAEVGDVFACHVVGNPDAASELVLLKAVTDGVDDDILQKVALAFGDLRGMSDRGDVSYPYSTREAVAVSKHLSTYPQDGVAAALANVVSFDAYDNAMLEVLKGVFDRHGLPFTSFSSVGALSAASGSSLSSEVPLRPIAAVIQIFYNGRGDGVPAVKRNVDVTPLSPSDSDDAAAAAVRASVKWARSQAGAKGQQRYFSEEILGWKLPEGLSAVAACSGRHSTCHLLCAPDALVSYTVSGHAISLLKLPAKVDPHCRVACIPMANLVLVLLPKSDQLVLLTADAQPKLVGVCSVPDLSKESDGCTKLLVNGLHAYAVLPTVIVDLDFSMYPSVQRLVVSTAHQLPFAVSEAFVLTDTRLQLTRRGEDTQYHFVLPPPDGRKARLIAGGSHAGYSVAGEVYAAFDDAGGADDKMKLRPPEIPRLSSMSRLLAPAKCTPTTLVARDTTAAHAVRMGPDPGIILSNFEGKDHTGFQLPDWKQDYYCYPSGAAPTDLPETPSVWLNTGECLLTGYPPNARGQVLLEVTDLRDGTARRIPLAAEPGGAMRVAKRGDAPVREPAFLLEMTNGRVVVVLGDRDVRLVEVRRGQLGKEERAWVDGGEAEKPEDADGEGKGSGTGEGSGSGSGVGEGGEGEGSGGEGGGGGGKLGEDRTPGEKAKKKEGSSTVVLDERFRLRSGNPTGDDDDGDGTANKKKQIDDELAAKVVAEAHKRVLELAQKKRVGGSDKPHLANLDASAYARLCDAVKAEVKTLRSVLEAVEAKEKERIWATHQTAGDLDDNRLVDGATGETTIFKRRAVHKPPPGAPQKKPKRLLFSFDVSASMAHFDSEDRRLARSAAVAVLIMESFASFQHKYDYSIVAHNGDSPYIEIVPFGQPPQTELDRFAVIKAIYGGTSCLTGDNTLAAAKLAVQKVVEEEADDYFVVLISDANVSQYGIDASSLSEFLFADPRVTSHVVLISAEHGALQLASALPKGTGHLVTDTAELPKVFQNLFEHSLLASKL
ncbi:hypothetical protein DIPPA_32734 [Diplonema papillatum]|nr:hypothetical protein DIPPA_32734 [Diplonema papillatum]